MFISRSLEFGKNPFLERQNYRIFHKNYRIFPLLRIPLTKVSCISYYIGSFSEIPLCCGKLNDFPQLLSIVFQIGISKVIQTVGNLDLPESTCASCPSLFSDPVSHVSICLSCCPLSHCIQTALLFP